MASQSRTASHSDLLWGIDLGGTKIECAVLESVENPVVLERRRIPTEGDLGYQHVLTNIHELIRAVANDIGSKPVRLGIGTPGTLDPQSGLLRGSNSQHLIGQPVGKDLEQRLGFPVIVENDANCFALAETRMGSVSKLEDKANSVFGIILGTGVGGGLVINNRLIRGRNAITGEWGHNHLDNSGSDCYCGKTGCVETVISGPALERYYTSLSTQKLKLPDISALAESGDPHATQTLDRLVHFFGIGVSGIVNMIDPDVIVIGGGVGNIERLYSDGVAEIARHIFAPQMHTRVVRPLLGDSAGVFGAAFLAE